MNEVEWAERYRAQPSRFSAAHNFLDRLLRLPLAGMRHTAPHAGLKSGGSILSPDVMLVIYLI